MNSILKYFLALFLISPLLFSLRLKTRFTHQTIPLQFIQNNTNGSEILKNIDQLLEHHQTKKKPKHENAFSDYAGEFNAQLNIANPSPDHEGSHLNKLWQNTSMIFGASADGIGVGTTFAIAQSTHDTAIFVTNFHVVEHFCDIPSHIIFDQVNLNDLKYSCQSLFVLHDVAINTHNKQTTSDGKHPWKSQIHSLLFFDKKLDLAIFTLRLPPDFSISINPPETRPIDLEPMELYQISYTTSNSPGSEGFIKKGWSKGTSSGLRAFETDDRLGIVSAIKHNLEIKPGSSGSPLALADGKVVGINSSLELNQYYANSGCSQEELETHLAFYAIPTVFLKPILLSINKQGDSHE